MAKLRCTILDDYQGAALGRADWARLADRVEVVALSRHIADEEGLVAELAGSDIVVAMRERTPFPESLLKRLPRLRLLITSGMRNAAIDVAAATRQGIVVAGTASASEPPTELTWALLLALARRIVPEANALRSGGPWQSTVGVDLHGKQLGLIGLGKIGTRVARIGAAFGMNVVAWSPNLTPERAAAGGARLAPSKAALLETSDFVSLHIVLSDRTRGLLGRDDLRRMRPDACLVNTSRAQLVDQPALVEALRNGWIAGAAVDVFAEEPLPAADPLRTLPNLLATPHLGYVSERNYQTYFREAVEDIEAFLAGKPVRTL